jgi:hypothetical protein
VIFAIDDGVYISHLSAKTPIFHITAFGVFHDPLYSRAVTSELNTLAIPAMLAFRFVFARYRHIFVLPQCLVEL